MVREKEQKMINSFNRAFKSDSRKVYLNHIIPEGGEAHARVMSLICLELRKLGIPFYCRYHLKTGGIVDVMLPLSSVAVEVMDSETKERFEKKDFSDEFLVVAVNVGWDLETIMQVIL